VPHFDLRRAHVISTVTTVPVTSTSTVDNDAT
jgi:hypothetical protein